MVTFSGCYGIIKHSEYVNIDTKAWITLLKLKILEVAFKLILAAFVALPWFG